MAIRSEFKMVKTSAKKEKAAQVRRAINVRKPDVEHLRSLALKPHGFVSSELRRLVWPKLLGLNVDSKRPHFEKEKLESHRDYNQVILDVNRSIKRFPKAMKEEHRNVLQEQLTTLIMKVLVNNPDLHYYQGYHDICVTFLLILGKDLSFLVVDYLSQNHLRDFMDEDMKRTRKMLNYLYPILGHADPALKDYMDKAEVGTIFCLSWLITWYGHVLDNSNNIVRLYDFFLSSHPLMPVYLASAVVLYRRDEVLSAPCEMCSIHVLLSNVPNNLPFDQLIVEANELFENYPPDDLADEAEFEFSQSRTFRNYSKFEKSLGIKTHSFHNTIVKSKRLTQSTQEPSFVYKATMWTFTAALGAAVLAMQYAVKEFW